MKKRYIVFCFVLVLMFFTGIVAGDATRTTFSSETYEEDFEDDIVDANPTETWYVYGESGLDYMNATDVSAYNSDQSYRMNETAGTGGALYNFTNERQYDYFELVFKIDNSSHNYTAITVGSWFSALSTNGAICYWNITNDTCTFYVLTLGTDVFTEVWNHTISNNTWYKIRAEFDYDDYSITGELWEMIYGVAGVPYKHEEDSDTCILEYTNLTQSFWAVTDSHGSDSNFIYMDDFVLGYTLASSTTIETSSPNWLLVMALCILALLILLGALKSGSLDSTFVIMLILALILVIVAVQMVFQVS